MQIVGMAWVHGLQAVAVYKGYYVLVGAKLADKRGWRVGQAAEKWIRDCAFGLSF